MLVFTRADIKASQSDIDDFANICSAYKVNLTDESVE